MQRTFMVKGMSCQHCSGRVKEALEKLQGVDDVTVDLAGGSVLVSQEGDEPSSETVAEAITKAGYTVVR